MKNSAIIASQDFQKFRFYLIILMIMVFGMVIIGGLTRLTGSGLSMVEWAPIMGIFPPLSHQEWQYAFDSYQQFPEYKLINSLMTIDEFKSIFWLEYVHRVWGRLMGGILLIPTIMSFCRAPLTPYRKHIIGIWILGGLQGIMGWYMVKSGLVQDPWVSPYRLVAHLGLAIVIFSILLLIIYSLSPHPQPKPIKCSVVRGFLIFIMILLLGTILFGGLTAGLKAGLVYNTFPDMNGAFIPDDFFFLTPRWRNLLENPTAVQFIHRYLALSTIGTIALFVIQTLRRSQDSIWRKMSLWLGFFAVIQVSLGILTLIMRVPILLAALHQGCAFVLFAMILWFTFHITGRKNHVYNLVTSLQS